MVKKLNIEIISPQGLLFEDSCTMAVVPSVEGEMGIMYDHEMVLLRLKSGKVSIYDGEKNIIKELKVSGGFAKILKENRLLILVDG